MEHCDFTDPDVVYLILGVSRNKLNQNPDEKFKQRRIPRVLTDIDRVDRVLDDIKALLKGTNYYIYVSVNPRSIAKASVRLTHKLIDANLVQDYAFLKKTEGMWTSALMDYSSRASRGVFMLDIDTKEEHILRRVKEEFDVKRLRETPNGFHAIVTPFDPRQLTNDKELSEVIGLKKDDFTFLNNYFG